MARDCHCTYYHYKRCVLINRFRPDGQFRYSGDARFGKGGTMAALLGRQWWRQESLPGQSEAIGFGSKRRVGNGGLGLALRKRT